MTKGFWAVIAIIIVIFGGIIIFQEDKADAPKGNGTQATSHVKGSNTTGVRLVEYGDFQCPVCGSYYPIVESLYEKYKDKVEFQYRHLPLTQIHQNAFAASRASEAADKQGKFWEMYNILFQNQQVWSDQDNVLALFEQYAKQIGLNVDQFKKDFASNAVNDTVNADLAEFAKTKQPKSTPTFFLDGKKITPTLSQDKTVEENVNAFGALIDEAIAAKNKQ
jgi:protein-disulfide isomerase